jgi:high-affinity Fe2+/Pb2+ permease
MEPSAERVSLMLGLAMLMLASVPRYLVGGHETRLLMALALAGAVVIAAAFQWRQLIASSRQRLPMLLKRLLACLVGGVAAIAMWYLLSGGWIGWERLISYGAGLGLLGYALWLWWTPREA